MIRSKHLEYNIISPKTEVESPQLNRPSKAFDPKSKNLGQKKVDLIQPKKHQLSPKTKTEVRTPQLNRPSKAFDPKSKNVGQKKLELKAYKLKGKFSKNQTKLKLKPKDMIHQKNQSLYKELVKINAFCGDTSLRNHYTQDSLIFAYRNDYSLYRLDASIFGLKKALHFLRKQKKNSLIFVGSPLEAKDDCLKLFQIKKIPFFPTTEWFPGYISKKALGLTKVLIIYDISTNYDAKREAFNAKFPIVAFLSIHSDIGGVDYPISLNLDHCGMWYHSLWKSFFIKA